MTNKKIIDIFVKSIKRIDHYHCLHPTRRDHVFVINKFSGADLILALDPDADVKLPEYLKDTKLLCYRDIRDNLSAQYMAEETKGACDGIFYNNQLTAITDTGVFFWVYYEDIGGVKHHHLWQDIESVESDGDVIIFHGEEDFALPAISICEADFLGNEEDFSIFVDTLDHMAS